PGQITFNSSTGMASVVREIQMLNAHDYATYVNQANWHATPDSLRIRGDSSALPYGGRTGSIRPDSIARLYGAGIDWQRAIFRTAATRDLQLSFSGGDGGGSYAGSGDYSDQDGAIHGAGLRRGDVRANLERTLNATVPTSTSLDL